MNRTTWSFPRGSGSLDFTESVDSEVSDGDMGSGASQGAVQ